MIICVLKFIHIFAAVEKTKSLFDMFFSTKCNQKQQNSFLFRYSVRLGRIKVNTTQHKTPFHNLT